jgi:adenylate kinase
MKNIIILLGVPGSGKGTQAEKISAKYGFEHISTGELFRALKKKAHPTAEEKDILDTMSRGELVSDSHVFRLTADKIEEMFETGVKGVVLDGAVRSIGQAEMFGQFFDEKKLGDQVVVLEVKISDETSLERLLYRKDNSTTARDDDNEEVMKNRVREQGNTVLQPIVDYYKKTGNYVLIDGESPIEDVERQIDEVMAK